MKIEYFQDTDTLLLQFNESTVEETRDLNENTLIEFDSKGRLVSMTIEHAKEQVNVEELIFHPGSIGEGKISMVAEEISEYQTKKDKQ